MARRKKKPLTPFQQVAQYVNTEVLPKLGIPQFSIHCLSEPAPSDALAYIEVVEGHHHGALRVCVGFFRLPRHLQRETLVHEAVHCVVRGMADIATGLVDAANDVEAVPENLRPLLEFSFRSILKAHTHQEELAVETMAQAVAPRIKLPNFKVPNDFQHLSSQGVSDVQAAGSSGGGSAKSRGGWPHSRWAGCASRGRLLRAASYRGRT